MQIGPPSHPDETVARVAHVLRHTFGSDLIRGGTDLVAVAELMGHASLDSTDLHPADRGRLDAAVARLTVDR